LVIATVDGFSVVRNQPKPHGHFTLHEYFLHLPKNIVVNEINIVFFTSTSMKIFWSGEAKMEEKGNYSLVHDFYNV